MEEILVIDDEPMIRSMMKIALAEMGYVVTGAKSVEEALSIYKKDTFRFSALVTDFNLEDGTGLDIVNVDLPPPQKKKFRIYKDRRVTGKSFFYESLVKSTKWLPETRASRKLERLSMSKSNKLAAHKRGPRPVRLY